MTLQGDAGTLELYDRVRHGLAARNILAVAAPMRRGNGGGSGGVASAVQGLERLRSASGRFTYLV
jgi:hypothetical protein